MTEPAPRKPDTSRLPLARTIAVLDGLAAGALAWYFMNGFREIDLVSVVISLAAAGIVYGGTFYGLALALAPGLHRYIVSDDTKISGQTVDLVTTTRGSGDADLDRWVESFVFARNLFGMSLIPLALLGAVFLLG